MPQPTELNVPLSPDLLARLERVAGGQGLTSAQAAASAIERYVRAAEGGWSSAAGDERLWRDVTAIAQRLYLGKRLGTVERQTAERFGLKALLLRLDAQGRRVTPEVLMEELRRERA